MEPQAIKQYKSPKYPKKEEIQAQPSLLRRSISKRWQRLYDLGVSGMLVASVSLAGCDKGPSTS